MNRTIVYRLLIFVLLLAMLAVPLLGAVAQGPNVAVGSPLNALIQAVGLALASPTAVACTNPPSSGGGCGGG